MPTYDYECPGEGEVREFNLPINHEPPACETCGCKMSRVFSPPMIQFKGDGFYSTGG
jgi:putative FmdB family regulatory protein